VGGVLSAVPGDHLVVAGVAPEREHGLEDVVAGLHQHQDTLDLLLALLDRDAGPLADILDQLVLDDLAGAVKEVLHHVEEPRVRRVGHVLEALRDLVVGVAAAGDRQCDSRQRALHISVTRRLLQSDRPREAPQVKHVGARMTGNDDKRRRRVCPIEK